MTILAEADAEAAALSWLEGLGWQVAHGPDIAPDTPNAERADYGQVVWNAACATPRRRSTLPYPAALGTTPFVN